MTKWMRVLASSRLIAIVCGAVCISLLAGCSLKQDMALQPKYRPLEPSESFADGRSERPLIEGTVARNAMDDDGMLVAKESNAFPLPVNAELLQRGEERYKIFCTPCHGLQGDGNGMIVMRGMKHPPSYHEPRLRQVTNGYIFDVITNGFGAMLNYSAQIPVRDRWAIVAYVRALQLSRNAKVSELPADVRERLLHPPAEKKESGAPEAGGAKE
jgi:mono/diheme cytochrome c family protein